MSRQRFALASWIGGCALALVTLVGAGCADAPSDSLRALELTVGYAGFDLAPLPAEGQPSRVTLNFPALPGAIFGNPGALPAFQIEAEVGKKTRFALDSVTLPEALAQPATQVSADPADCRLLRFATFPMDESGAGLGGGAFLDPESRQVLMLVYVDRACALQGDLPLQGERYSVAVNLPEAGFHWLLAEKLEEGSYLVRRHETHRPVLFAIVRPPAAG